MKYSEKHIDGILSKVLIICFVLALSLLFAHNQVGQKLPEGVDKVLCIKTQTWQHAVQVAESKIPGLTTNWNFTRDFEFLFAARKNVKECHSEMMTALRIKHLNNKFTAFKAKVYLKSFLINYYHKKNPDIPVLS
jgi:hypothetical protein